MAKKKGNFSYIETQEALEAISTTATKESIPYNLLRIFCGYGDASLARVADGRGNDAKDGKTILIKKLLYNSIRREQKEFCLLTILQLVFVLFLSFSFLV